MKEEKSIMQVFCFVLQKPGIEEYVHDFKLFASFYCITSFIQCCLLDLNE